MPSAILRNKWKSEEHIQKIKSPILFIKCISFHILFEMSWFFNFNIAGRDELIPCTMIDQLREKSGSQMKETVIHDLVNK